jgi:putative hydrolase of the HAD superfamily
MSILKDKDIKAICLDIDGTLYSKAQMNLRLIPTGFPNIKLGLSFNKIRQLYRQTQETEPPKTNDRLALVDKQARLYLKDKNPSDKKVQKVIDQIDKQFYKACEKSFLSIKGFDNMVETLIKAKDMGLTIALLSDFPVGKKVTTLKLENIVDYATSSEDSGYLKPSSKPFEFLCNHLNLDPKNCIYIGDSYNKDIVGAKKIDMQTIYISNKANKGNFTKADYICKDWFEIENLLLK